MADSGHLGPDLGSSSPAMLQQNYGTGGERQHRAWEPKNERGLFPLLLIKRVEEAFRSF